VAVTGDGGFALFGAYERHNLGDWLMAWCFEELVDPTPGPWLTMGEAPLDRLGHDRHLGVDAWRAAGGGSVLHVGGDVLGCDSDTARLFVPADVEADYRSPFPYLLGADRLGGSDGRRALYGAGASNIDQLDDQAVDVLREVLGDMPVTVRDQWSLDQLATLGIHADLAPCVVSLMPRLLAAPTVDDPPLVLQLADHVDGALVDAVIQEVADLATSRAWPVVVIVAGLAAGHDSLSGAARHVARLRAAGCRADLMSGVAPLATCATVAGASLVVSSSLHLRILAMAYGVRRMSLAAVKADRYVSTWDDGGAHASRADEVSAALADAVRVDDGTLLAVARRSEEAAGRAVEALSGLFGASTGGPVADDERRAGSGGVGGLARSSDDDLVHLAERAVEFEGQRDHLAGLAAQAEDRADRAEERAVEFEGQRDHLAGLAAQAEDRAERLGAEVADLGLRNDDLRDTIDDLVAREKMITTSRSWRLTRPLRWLAGKFRA